VAVLVDAAAAKREEEVDFAAARADEVRPEVPHGVAHVVAREGDPEAEAEAAAEVAEEAIEAETEAATAQRERETRWKMREYACGPSMRQQQTDAMQRLQYAPTARTRRRTVRGVRRISLRR
jgi:hypothetical protein